MTHSGNDPHAGGLDLLNLPLELEVFCAISPTAQLGAGLVVYAKGRDMCDQAVNALEFFRNESCGKCVPCRLGSQKLAVLGQRMMAGWIAREEWSSLKPAVNDLLELVASTSICGLGRSVPWPLRTLMTLFADDVALHLDGPAVPTSETES